ncbi:class D sortase [Laceyella sacchari]|uniref:Class D sortase n=1 Tax=Laceyella sacchari TaxID=37482 RepID=A0ABY5U3A8_LACSH|nr:class D sortase [Laceyella sacchari]TCW40428.1 sortase A [Laceyella sacchari]UWE04089.1 class D sortase [Laceyella sacchari]
MKWDRVIALALVTAGVAYASYSAVNYIEKLQVVTTAAGSGQEAPKLKSAPPRKHADQWVVVPKEERPKRGEHFADLLIPKLDARMPIIEGTHEDELASGVGHYAGSVLPGEPDNAVLSGHRDTVFRKIGQLKKGDELRVRTKQGTFVYVITKTWVTKPDDRTVIVPHGKPVLTLTTCYPFTFVGPAPERYIIQSELKQKLDESAPDEQGG